VGEVTEVREGEDICSTKEDSDYCLRPDDDETVVRAEHYPSEDGVRVPDDEGGGPVHYARNLDVLDCERDGDMRVCRTGGDSFKIDE
jgi:hypothetical protein